MARYFTLGGVLLGLVCASVLGEERLFPFVVPGDDVSAGVTDMSFLNDRPADQLVTVRDGHFYAGEKRIRFWGMNNDFWANYPTHEEAQMLARRFAKLGMNILRITHTDNAYAPMGLFDPALKGEMRIDPAQMEKLDYFIAELKKRGIYVELSLHVHHLKMMGAKGIPDIGNGYYSFGSGLPFWNEKFIEAEKQYARDFFGHVNQYTGKPYTEEPAVAFVEIVNENGIICAWDGGHLKKTWSEALIADLRASWNAYLKKKYQTTDALRQAWAEGERAVDGSEMLQNPNFARGTEGWGMQCVAPSTGALQASRDGYDGRPCAVATCDPKSDQTWHVNLHQMGLAIEQDCIYQLSFAAKADEPVKVHVGVAKDHPPWGNLGLSMQPDLTKEWQGFSQCFVGLESDSRSKVIISIAQVKNTLRFADFSLKKVSLSGLPKDESLEAGSVALPLTPADCLVRTPQFTKDFVDFLYEVDDQYFTTIYNYLKNDLGCKHPIKGTQVNGEYSSFFTQAKCDFLDVHAYWQHPHFPRKPWDRKDWTIRNTPMVNGLGSTVVRLAAHRVKGKPFNVSEYCHPAPNTHCSEEIPTVTSFAAFQDWDGITLYTYAARDYLKDMIPSYFEHKSHPTKLVTMPFGALVFRRADVAPAKEEASVGITLDDIKQHTHSQVRKRSWGGFSATDKGATWLDAFTHRLSVFLGSSDLPKFQPPDQTVAVSDTSEMTYDMTNKDAGVLVVNSTRSKAVIGFGAGKTFDLGDLILKPGSTRQNGFSVITASVVSGGDFHSPGSSILVTATGYAENTDMGWNADKSSVGDQWGKGPALCEGIPFELILTAKAAKAWALDPRGQRASEVVPEQTAEGVTLRLGPQHKTLWYEVAIE